ncbi:clavesin-1-like [Amblyomma americanum]
MNKELEEIARNELGETPEVQKEALAQFRQRLEEENGLRIPPDDVLIKFLRAAKYRVDKALKTFRNFFRARRDMPEYFKGLTPSTIPYKSVFRDHKLLMFPEGKDPEGRTMLMIRFGAWKHSISSMDDLVKCFIVGAECALLDDDTQIRGFVGVDDLKGLGVHHLVDLTPGFLRRVVTLVQDTFPARIKGVYFINAPAFFEGLYSLLIRPFLSKKLKKRVHITSGGLSELIGLISPELIPKEFGGTLEDFDFDAQERRFHEKTAYFENIQQYGYMTA